MLSTPYVISLILTITLPTIFFLAPYIFPSKQSLHLSLSDELDDLALFRRATLASLSPSSSIHLPSNKPKIAFLFLTTTHIPFSPLWNKFFLNHHHNPHLYNIYVHSDPSSSSHSFTGVFTGRVILSKPTERGSPSLISAERRLLATALIDDHMNMYFSLVSPSCIPLHSFKYVYNSLFHPTLFDTKQKQKIELISYIEIIDHASYLPARYDARGKGVMLPEIPYEKFRGGSQFFVLNRKHAIMVIRDQKLWRKFRLPCINIYSCYPEEHYFPTLLSMEDPKGCSNYTLTRVNWTKGNDGHPNTYEHQDVSPDLIFKLRKSNSSFDYLFARKFSPSCLDKLMDMSDKIIFRD